MFNKNQNYFTSEKTGLSMSDAQSVSNMCNQKAAAIESKLKSYNNYGKILDMTTCSGATGNENPAIVKVVGVPIPSGSDVKALILQKANYHALQGFLMEHIKLKETLIQEAEAERDFGFNNPTHASLELEKPIHINDDPAFIALGAYVPTDMDARQDAINKVLSASDILDLNLYESKAAHLGMYFHKDGHLDKLRKELPKLPEFELMEFPDKRTALVYVNVHHTVDGLTDIYADLADEHRTFERKVNAIKAKIKTAETEFDNAEKERHQAYLNRYDVINKRVMDTNAERNRAYNAKVQELRTAHYVKWNTKISELAKLRIVKHDSFATIFEEFFKK